ncbi:MAG: bacillithiol biosynthesis BshC, partial [Acidobacteria bacterium]|nr:bacillithiol biosynthesis BshC [Acidobacteriota bacterium]
VALFRLGETRQPIRVVPEGFAVGERVVGADDLLREVDAHPARFSPNVLLRPLVQDALFPTAAYVSGPNELAYLGQLRGVYERFGIPMPIIFPRTSATIVDRATVRFLERYGLDFANLRPRDDAVLNRLLAALIPAELETALAGADAAVDERLAAVSTAVPLLDPTLSGVVESTRKRMQRDLATLRGKVVQAAKRRDETLRRQFRRARAQAFPNGEPQERSVGTVYFLNRYGPAFVDRLLADLPLDPGRHWLLTI